MLDKKHRIKPFLYKGAAVRVDELAILSKETKVVLIASTKWVHTVAGIDGITDICVR
jgi:hypothetical protein